MILSKRWVWCVSKKTSVNIHYSSEAQFKLIAFGLEFHWWWDPQSGRNGDLVPESPLDSSVIQVFPERCTFCIFSKRRFGHDMRSRDKYMHSFFQKGDLSYRMAQTMTLSSDLHAIVTGIVCVDCAHHFWLSRGQSSMWIAWFFQVHRSLRAVSILQNGVIGFLLPVAILVFQRAKVDEITRSGKGRIRQMSESRKLQKTPSHFSESSWKRNLDAYLQLNGWLQDSLASLSIQI